MMKFLRQVFCLILIVKVSSTLFGNVTRNVVWYVVTSPLVYGEDVTLKCIITMGNKSCCSEPRSWKRQGNNLIVYNESPVNPQKYQSQLMENSFTLIIKNISLEDVDISYTCSYEFVQFTANLTSDSFELHPPKDSIIIVTNASFADCISYVVHFTKVYPVPECYVKAEENAVSPLFTESNNFTSYFYDVKSTLVYCLTHKDCGKNISIECIIAPNKNIIIYNSELPSNCTVSAKTQDSNELSPAVIAGYILTSLLILVIMAVLLYLRIWKKMNCRERADKPQKNKLDQRQGKPFIELKDQSRSKKNGLDP